MQYAIRDSTIHMIKTICLRRNPRDHVMDAGGVASSAKKRISGTEIRLRKAVAVTLQNLHKHPGDVVLALRENVRSTNFWVDCPMFANL